MARRGRRMGVLAALLTWLIPRGVGYWLVDHLADVAYLLVGRYRRAALANVSQALGRPTSDPSVRRVARQCFRTSARNFWDLCSMPHTNAGWMLRRTSLTADDWAVLHAAVARGRGVIVVTGHIGAFDSVGQMLALLPTRPLILTMQTTSGWLFHAVTWLRSSWGARVEPVTSGAIRRVLGHLRRGGVVGLVSDRDVSHTGRPVMLFGRPTTLPAGVVRLALDTGATVVAVFCPREGDHFRFLVEEVPLQRTGDLDRDVDQSLAVLAALLERHIRAWPDQWVVFERIWPE